MHYRLYKPNVIEFKTLLEEAGYSRTYIKNNLWKYHDLFTKILDKRRFTTSSKKYVKIDMTTLRNLYSNTKINGKPVQLVNHITKDLVKWSVIKYHYVNNPTDNGIINRSSYYKVLDEVTADGWSQWLSNREIPVKHIKEQLTGMYTNIPRSLSLVTVDYKAATAFALNAKQNGMKLPDKLNGWFLEKDRRVNDDVYSSWLMSLNYIVDGNYYTKIEYKDSGRVYTPITSFPKKLMQYVRLSGKPLVQLDCSNSQPLLFSVFLKQNYKELTDDMKKYIQLTEKGELYSYIKNLLTTTGLTFNEDGFKAEFFAKIFYSKEKKSHKWRTLFATEFPNVAAAITKEKQGEPKKLSKKLSLLESEIMIKGVARKVYENNIYEILTKHDAILTTEDNVDMILNIMLAEFRNYGIKPTIKVENI